MQGFLGEVAKDTPIRSGIRDRLRDWWDRTFHGRCLPPRNYPLSRSYLEKARGDVAATVTAGWPIEFDDLDALRKRACEIPKEKAVQEWIDRRKEKVAKIYEARAWVAFRDVGFI